MGTVRVNAERLTTVYHGMTYLESDGKDVHLLDETGLVGNGKLEQPYQGRPELFPGIPEPHPRPLLVGEEAVNDGQGVQVQLVGKTLHHVGPNKLDLFQNSNMNGLCGSCSDVGIICSPLGRERRRPSTWSLSRPAS